ncbi:MAG: hypothetical protein SGPRY_001779 [Prymnesium sp.]
MHTWDVGEGHLWNVMVRMTETAHPHSIGHGEFHVASQPEEEMSKIFVASYVRGFTAARTKLYGLFEKPDWECSSLFEVTGAAICTHMFVRRRVPLGNGLALV